MLDSRLPNSPDISAWRQEASNIQQFMYEMLGDRKYDLLNYDDPSLLRTKLEFAMYGLPTYIVQHGQCFNTFPPGGDAAITAIQTKIINTSIDFESDGIYFAPIFICIKVHDKHYLEVVFRIGNSKNNKYRIIDTNADDYENWNTFIANSWYPKCILMYPTNGLYERDDDLKVKVEIRKSLACTPQNRICRMMLTLTSNTILTPVNRAFRLMRCSERLTNESRLELLDNNSNRNHAFETLLNLLTIPEHRNKFMTNKAVRLLRALQSLRTYLQDKDEDLNKVCHSLTAMILFFNHCRVSADDVRSLMLNFDQIEPVPTQEYGPTHGVIPITYAKNEIELMTYLCKGRIYNIISK